VKWKRYTAPTTHTTVILLAPALQDWSSENLAHTPSEIMDTLDLSAITSVYEQQSRGLLRAPSYVRQGPYAVVLSCIGDNLLLVLKNAQRREPWKS
jgi:hypothetical protein